MPVKPTPILSKINSKMKTFSANETAFTITTQDLEWNMKQMLAILAAVKKTEEVQNLVVDFMNKIVEIVPDVVDAPKPEPPNLEPSTPEPSAPPEPSGVAKNVDSMINDYIANDKNISTKVEDTTSQLSDLKIGDFKIGDRVKAKKHIFNSSKKLLVLQECHGVVEGVNTTKSTITVLFDERQDGREYNRPINVRRPAKNIEHIPGENVCPENIDLACKITSPEGQQYMTTLTEESVKQEETTITCVDFTKPCKDGIYQGSESLIDLNIIKKSLEDIPDSTTHLILNNAPVEVVDELVEKGFVETATKKLKVLEINLPKGLHDVNLEEEWHSHHISTTLLNFCKGLNIDLTEGKVVYPLGDEPHEDGYPDDPFGKYVIWAINGSDYIATKGKIASIEFPGHFCSGVMINNKMSYWTDVQEWENEVNNCLNRAIRRHGDDAISAETQFWDDRSFNYEEWGKDNYVIIRS